MESQLIAVIVSMALIGIGYFAKAYLSEKGKSLATKEDIAKITEKVESVKTAFAIETEKLKSELQLGNAKKQLVTHEKIKCLIEFSEKYYLWYTMCMSGGLIKVNCKTEITVKEEKEKFSQAYFEVLMAQSKIKMFLYDKDVILSIGECIGNTLKLNHEFERAIEAMHAIEVDFERLNPEKRNIEQYFANKSEILRLHRASIEDNQQLFLTLTHKMAESYRKYFDSL